MSDKKLTKPQQRKADAREDYEQHGLTVKEIAIKHGYAEGTIRGYISSDKWQKQPLQDLLDTVTKAEKHLSVLFNEDISTLKSKLYGDSDSADEIDEIQTLATIMMVVAKGGASTVKKTFSGGEEKFREVQTIAPSTRAGMFYMELSEKLASMVDIGEFETDAELEERYKGYEKKILKQREEFANRDLG